MHTHDEHGVLYIVTLWASGRDFVNHLLALSPSFHSRCLSITIPTRCLLCRASIIYSNPLAMTRQGGGCKSHTGYSTGIYYDLACSASAMLLRHSDSERKRVFNVDRLRRLAAETIESESDRLWAGKLGHHDTPSARDWKRMRWWGPARNRNMCGSDRSTLAPGRHVFRSVVSHPPH